MQNHRALPYPLPPPSCPAFERMEWTAVAAKIAEGLTRPQIAAGVQLGQSSN